MATMNNANPPLMTGELCPTLRVSFTTNGETACLVTVRVFVHKSLPIKVRGVKVHGLSKPISRVRVL